VKKAPVLMLSDSQKEVVEVRNRPIQVIACAGSGKTESISCRIAALIDEGEHPESIIAFTFTERAAAELKERVYRRVEDVKGAAFLGRLGPMFVGTIHGYCFRLLQYHVPRYGNYDVLDEHRHFGFLSREYKDLGLHKLGSRHWQPIRDFAKAVDVIGNELIQPVYLQGTPLGDCYKAYLELLERYHFLTFGLIIAKAVEVLGDPQVFMRVHAPLRHLLVDEYQDINPAQERLIELLSKDPVQLCVVGDDDQSIYQWRGSDISNILNFAERHIGTKVVMLEINRRSRPEIVRIANDFARSISGRLNKAMKPVRMSDGCQVVTWSAETEDKEAAVIADTIHSLRNQGYRYQDIAILYRSVRTSAPPLVEALESRGIPYSCGGRTGLFLQPEISLFGEIFAWFIGGDWKDVRFGPSRPADLERIASGLIKHFNNGKEIQGLQKYLEDWRSFRFRSNRPVSLVGDFYMLLNFLGAHNIDIDSPEGSSRFGAFARFSKVLADFEHVTRRGRYVAENDKQMFRGGRDRGKPFYQKLHNYLLHYARDAYEDFEGEQIASIDSVDILTVHQAKGLEWPIVFLPAMTDRRFPSTNAGRSQEWLLGKDVFSPAIRVRYEGGESEERRLFYVALTRARDAVYASYFERITRKTSPSPYLIEIAKPHRSIQQRSSLSLLPGPEAEMAVESPALEVSFSDIANFEECGHRYRLSRLMGFQQELAIELGYGKALHHVLRQIAEKARAQGDIPAPEEIESIIDKEFYLPFADQPTFDRMNRAAGLLVNRYMRDYPDDLKRVWATERPFEVHLEGGLLAGRADIILDEENGRIGRLAIVDYKTATDPLRDERYELQLGVYASAARGEGLEVVAGYLHELKDGIRRIVDISEPKSKESLAAVARSIRGIRSGNFIPCPTAERCAQCEYRLVCGHSGAKDYTSDQSTNYNQQADRNPDGLQGYVIGRILNGNKSGNDYVKETKKRE
jgi:DNA helicase-2/ATP-dependent DNA helicase PcrA